MNRTARHGRLDDMVSTLLMLLIVVLAGWAVTAVLRAPRSSPDRQRDWEHWLEESGLRPVIPRTRPVVEAATAAGFGPAEVERAAAGRARDGAMLVVAQLAGGETLIAARRSGPLPIGVAQLVRDGWQASVTTRPLDVAWHDATWLRDGPTVAR